MERPVTPKKDNTSLVTLIVTSMVALLGGVITNFDKLFSGTKPPTTEISATKETTETFDVKLNKVIIDSAVNFANIIGNLREEDEAGKSYYSKINVLEGLTTVYFPTDKAEKAYYQVDILTTNDLATANQKYSDIYKLVSETLQSKSEPSESVDENVSTQMYTFEKGNSTISVYIISTTISETEVTYDVLLTIETT